MRRKYELPPTHKWRLKKIIAGEGLNIHGPCLLPTPDRLVSFVFDSIEIWKPDDAGRTQPFYGLVLDPPVGAGIHEYFGNDLLLNVPSLWAEFFEGGKVAAFRLADQLTQIGI